MFLFSRKHTAVNIEKVIDENLAELNLSQADPSKYRPSILHAVRTLENKGDSEIQQVLKT